MEVEAAIGAYLVYFVAVPVASSGLAAVIEPLLRPAWLHDDLFFGLALAHRVGIAHRYVRAVGAPYGVPGRTSLERRTDDARRRGRGRLSATRPAGKSPQPPHPDPRWRA